MHDQTTMKYVATGVICLLVGAAIGVFSAPYLHSNSNDTYQAGFNAAKALVEKSSLGGVFKAPEDVRILSGTITAINGSSLTLHTPSVNPFDDPILSDRIILITASTTVLTLVQKDQNVLQAEMAAFTKASQSTVAGTSVTKPSFDPFLSVISSVKNISVGDTVTVIASENVKTLRTFSASEIRIMPKLVAP